MSGPVRTPDEMLPADAASGAGRTPAGRPAVWHYDHRDGDALADLYSPAGRLVGNILPGDVLPLCDLLNDGLALRNCGGVHLADLPETAAEHVRNALQLLAVFDCTYPVDGKRFVVYQADDIAAVTARLRKALGES